MLGNVLATMLLRQAANAYGVVRSACRCGSTWPCPLGMLGLVAVAAVLPAVRAGRLSAVQAIAAGRAPRPGRGYAAHRLLGRLRLPRPVTIGLAAPFARPARTAVTLVAVLLGAAAVTFAVGLGASLSRVVGGLSQAAAQPVQICPTPERLQLQCGPAAGHRGGAAGPAGDAALRGRDRRPASVAGQSGQFPLTAFRGTAAWTGYPMISGHWYTGPGQASCPPDSSP